MTDDGGASEARGPALSEEGGVGAPPGERTQRRDRAGTTTSNFGVGRRENHDASGFYGRFRTPEVSTDDTVLPPEPIAEPLIHGDARHMDAVADGSVALVVTSPPYFAGKQYEEELQREGVPGSYLEFLGLLTERSEERRVGKECRSGWWSQLYKKIE